MGQETETDVRWYFIHDGLEYGPLSDDQMCRAADSGLLVPTDVVWRSDEKSRFSAGEVANLFPVLEDSVVADASASYPSQANAVGYRPAASAAISLPTVGSGSLICPNCWYRFEPEDILFIASHSDLVGDPVVGAGQAQRFRPVHYTPDGNAIDAEGMISPHMACPRCHLRIPRCLLNLPPLFVSMVGAPGSGKSYLLASMIWKLRKTLPRDFLVRFTDADNLINGWLSDYEERLFRPSDGSVFETIQKTQMEKEGGHYESVNLGGMTVLLPRPVIFQIESEEASLFHENEGLRLQRSLVLYDNAGEQFLPEANKAGTPGSQHLKHADGIMFLLDPTVEPEIRNALKESNDIQLKQQGNMRLRRQDVLLTEIINRIRQYLGLDARTKYRKPMAVLVSKADVLTELLGADLERDPWTYDKEIDACSLDVTHIMQTSFRLRSMLIQHVPHVVTAVESFATDVIFIPVSALGHSPSTMKPTKDVEGAILGVRPCDISPRWVEVPLLFLLFKMGYVAGAVRCDDTYPIPRDCVVRGGHFSLAVPGTSERLRIPLSYAGVSLQCPVTGKWFRLPDEPSEPSV